MKLKKIKCPSRADEIMVYYTMEYDTIMWMNYNYMQQYGQYHKAQGKKLDIR